MRIAYLNTLGIPAHYGGFETCVEEVSTRLVRRGHDVTVYCASRLASKHSSYEGVKLISVPGASNKFVDFPVRSFLSTADAMSRDFDIFHYYGTDSWIFALLPRAISKNVVISLDGLVWNRSSYARWVRAALRITSWVPLYLARRTVVDSSHVRAWYLRTYGRAPTYIPYGARISPRHPDIDVLRRFGLKEEEYILFVGRLVPEKGVHHLIEAFNKLGTQSKLQLVIVGSNPYGSAYEVSLRKAAGENRVRFLGYVYGSEMENLFKGAYLYVTASELEGTSPAILSAMGFGNCVLASDILENVETLGDAGVTFRTRDPRDLRDKMLYLLQNPDVVQTYRRRAFERVSRFYSWDAVADRMEQVYFSLTTANHERPFMTSDQWEKT
jgi:glycosyltransferase involved in cell wall biosynthesis